MQIIITADDFGVSESVNASILETADHGPVSNLSILPNGEAFEHGMAEFLKRADSLSLAVHVNLTEGSSVADPAAVPLLVDVNGMFKHSVGTLWLAYLLSAQHEAFRRQIRIEIEAQVAKVRTALANRATIASVNGHQHVHMLPFVFDELLAVHDIPAVRIPHELASLPSVGSFFSSWAQMIGWAVLTILCFRNQRLSTAYTTLFVGILYSGNMTYRVVETALRRVASRDVDSVEILFHPGSAAEGDFPLWRKGRGNIAWHFSPRRADERAFLLSDTCPRLLRAFEQRTLPIALDPLKLLRFIVSGTCAAATQLGLLYVFTEYAGIWYVLSSTLGWIGGFFVSFTLQKYWTFGDRSHDTMGRQTVLYFLLQGFNLVLNGVALFVLTDILGAWYLASQVVVLLAIALWTYVASHSIFNTAAK